MPAQIVNNMRPLYGRIIKSLRWTLVLYGIVAFVQIGLVLFSAYEEIKHPEIEYSPGTLTAIIWYCIFWFFFLPFIAGGVKLVLSNELHASRWHKPILHVLGRLILLSVLYFLTTLTFPVWD